MAARSACLGQALERRSRSLTSAPTRRGRPSRPQGSALSKAGGPLVRCMAAWPAASKGHCGRAAVRLELQLLFPQLERAWRELALRKGLL
eukprot:scaffold95524_cov66-Phaeocystis_antarctica.AAC.4